MNEEEKKAIKFLKETEFDYLEYDICVKSVETVLSLIKKLQKENEELKDKVMEKELEIIGKEEYIKADMREIIEQYYTANEDCIPTQKVKDKIEEFKNTILENLDEDRRWCDIEVVDNFDELEKALIEERSDTHENM